MCVCACVYTAVTVCKCMVLTSCHVLQCSVLVHLTFLGLTLGLSLWCFTASVLSAGTTATVALLRDGIELVVASVGDSRAMLCRKGKALKLTVDHTPERKDEKER